MQVMIHAMYPPSVTGKMIQLFMDPNTPARPTDSQELASISYIDRDGYHTIFIYAVEDHRVSEFLDVQVARSVYVQSRVEGLRIEVQTGRSVPESVKRASSLIPTK